MHAIRPAEDNVLSIALRGALTVDDYEAVVPTLEAAIERGNEVRVIWDLSELEAIEPAAIWRDVVFDMRHRTEFARIAIISDRRWRNWATRLFRSLTDEAVRQFDVAERDEAHRWVRSGGRLAARVGS